MTRKPDPTIQIPHYEADEDTPATREPTPDVRTDGQSARRNRGQRAPHSGSGVVIGSGAGAGGGDTQEDFDSDDAGGSQARD